MFYRPGTDDHGLKYNPFKALISPRPIAWISSVSREGAVNLAPYSFFNAFADVPPILAYGDSGQKAEIEEAKDSLTNVRQTGEFVVNIVSYEMIDAMNKSSGHYPAGQNEFEIAGVEPAPCETVAAPRVAQAPASFECKLWKILDLPGGVSTMVIGEVSGIHYRDDFVKDGRIDVTAYQPAARLGYRDFSKVDNVFELQRPDD